MSSLSWAVIQYDWCPYKKGKVGHRNVEREDNVKTQREDSHLQAKERGMGQISFQSPQKEPTPPIPCSQTTSFHTCSYCLSHPVCGICYGSPSNVIHMMHLLFILQGSALNIISALSPKLHVHRFINYASFHMYNTHYWKQFEWPHCSQVKIQTLSYYIANTPSSGPCLPI